MLDFGDRSEGDVVRRMARLWATVVLLLGAAAPLLGAARAPTARPNVVVIMFDDMSPRVGAFGDALAPSVAQYLGPKAPEELYDLRADPDTVRNLAADPAHASDLIRLRRALDRQTARVGDMSRTPELEMVRQMWPGLRQPATAPVNLASAGRGRARLTSATDGASIGYRLPGETAWRLYVGPLEAAPGTLIEAKAIRYGYAESPVSRLTVD